MVVQRGVEVPIVDVLLPTLSTLLTPTFAPTSTAPPNPETPGGRLAAAQSTEPTIRTCWLDGWRNEPE